MEPKLVSKQSEIDIPKDLMVCPYCGKRLVLEDIDQVSQEPDGSWVADSIILMCEDEPSFSEGSAAAWQRWHEAHSNMPYVYQLPVEQKVLEHINKHYRIDIGR